MAWTYADIAAAYKALSPVPASLAAAAAALNAQTVADVVNTDGASMRGVLYTRTPAGAPSSLERVMSVAAGVATVTTPAPGYIAAEVVVLAQTLAGILQRGDAFPMTVPAVAAKANSDLGVLMASKLADGKGILWAAGELASGDPGDGAALIGTLVNVQVPRWQPALTNRDIWLALGQPAGVT